jgi:starvation-inducible DNA-binding protein
MNDSVVQLLNQQLADTVDLRSQARQARLNVRDVYAQELTWLFDGLAQELRQFADALAQRICDLGGHPLTTVRFAARASHLRDYPLDALDPRDHLEALLSGFSRYEFDTQHNRSAAKKAGDLETDKLLAVIAVAIEKNLWFIEAYLEGIAVGLQPAHLPQWRSAFQRSRDVDLGLRAASSGDA